MDKYLETNKEAWNRKTSIHIASAFYDVKGFKEGRSTLNEIELEALGDIRGKSLLHLQCHFGMDTLSWAKEGAEVTGIDFSHKAIDEARKLSEEMNIPAVFVCSNIYDLPQNLDQKFDIVFTSYGTIGWLPYLEKWGSIISHFLKPGGTFFIIEFHPFIWMMDDDFKEFIYAYFNTDPIKETVKGTYADRNVPDMITTYGWNHSLAETLNALIINGLRVDEVKEYAYSVHSCFPNMIELEKGKWEMIEPHFSR